MYKLCKTEESTARQKLIENGLMELMRQSRFETISVSSLCNYVGVPRNSFYRYFNTKEDTLLALIDHTVLEANEYSIRVWSGGEEMELADLEAFFGYWQGKRDFLDAIVKNDRSWLLIERSISFLEQKRMNTKESILSEAFAKEQRHYIVTYGMMSILLLWHRSGYQATLEEMAKVAYDLFSSSNIIMQDVL